MDWVRIFQSQRAIKRELKGKKSKYSLDEKVDNGPSYHNFHKKGN